MGFREERIVEMREKGATLQEIGNDFGLTRERVRQILAANSQAPNRAQARLARVAKENISHLRNVTQAKAQLNLQWNRYKLLGPDEASHTLGVTKADLWTIATKHQAAVIQGNSVAHAREVQWTDLQCVKALRIAAKYSSPLSHKKYDELRFANKFEGPSAILLLKRYGTWLNACKTAGIEGGKAMRQEYVSKWTDRQLLDYLLKYLHDAQIEKWSLNGFRIWLVTIKNSPSIGMFRNRLGSWYEMLAKSAPLIEE
jgi:hypothetical protein